MPADAMLSLEIEAGAGPALCNIEVTRLVIAGWTGRHAAAAELHIAKLEDPVRVRAFRRGYAVRDVPIAN